MKTILKKKKKSHKNEDEKNTNKSFPIKIIIYIFGSIVNFALVFWDNSAIFDCFNFGFLYAFLEKNPYTV